MNQREAFKDLIILAGNEGMNRDGGPATDPFSYNHIVDMQMRIIGADAISQPFSEAKLGRWLGWAQCAVAVFLKPKYGAEKTLEMMKTINMKWAGK